MSSCIVCGETKFTPLYEELLLKCTFCQFVTANCDLDESDINSIYDEGYFHGNEYEDYLRDKEIFIYNFEKRLRAIIRKNPDRAFNDVLEIGCAYGFFGMAFKSFFPQHLYKGLDITPVPVKYGAKHFGLDLECIDYMAFKVQKGFSDIFMWDVIEHLPNPELFVEKIHKDLCVGGRLYLTTGDISTLLPRIQGQKWRMIHPPSHLHYFSKKTISLFLKRKGFKVISLSYPSVSRSLKQIYYSLFLLNKRQNNFLKKLHQIIPERIRVSINTFDIMFVVAERE